MEIFHRYFFDVNLDAISRRFAASPRVKIIGYIPAKVKHMRGCFQTYNFSFILGGHGTFLSQGRILEVRAPCVLTQSPGEPVDYGPDEHWEELFLMYAPDQIDLLTAQGLIRPTPPIWYIHEPAQMHTHLSELLRLISAPHIESSIDIIDTLCALLIMESILGETPSDGHEEISVIRAIEAYINTHLHEEIHFAVLAASFHLHPGWDNWERHSGFVDPQHVKELEK